MLFIKFFLTILIILFLMGYKLDLFSDLNGYVLASDVFVNSLPVVGLKSFGLSPEKFLTLELSDVKEEFY